MEDENDVVWPNQSLCLAQWLKARLSEKDLCRLHNRQAYTAGELKHFPYRAPNKHLECTLNKCWPLVVILKERKQSITFD